MANSKIAIKQADELENTVYELRKAFARLKERDGRISAAWKGDSAAGYLRKLRLINDELDQIIAKIETAATSIKENEIGDYNVD